VVSGGPLRYASVVAQADSRFLDSARHDKSLRGSGRGRPLDSRRDGGATVTRRELLYDCQVTTLSWTTAGSWVGRMGGGSGLESFGAGSDSM
jgi:hypothetical protein